MINRRRVASLILSLFFLISTVVMPESSIRAYTPVDELNPTGNILFEEEFESGTYDQWTTNGGTWSVTTDGSNVLRQSHTSNEAFIFAGDNSWTDYSYEAKIKLVGSGAYPGILARATNTANYYYFQLHPTGSVVLTKVVNGTSTTLASADMAVDPNMWYTLKVELRGNSIIGYVDGKRVANVVDDAHVSGRIGMRTRWGVMHADDIIVKDLRTLHDDFEDGDYDGWAVYGGNWSVTDNLNSQGLGNALQGKSEGYILSGNMDWDNYWLESRYMPLADSGDFAMIFRALDQNNHYMLKVSSGKNTLELIKKINGIETVLNSTNYSMNLQTWYRMKVGLAGKLIRCYVNDTLLISVEDDVYTSGRLGFWTNSVSGYIDEVQAGSLRDPSKILIDIEGTNHGRVFEGLGIVTGNNSSRLLMDYPEEQLDDIMDILFKPNFAASLHNLKIEIGSDVNSSSGTEPSHMRSLTDFDITRGAGLWFAQKAKAVNPDIDLDALRWGTPSFIGSNLENKYLYYKNFLQGARDVYGLEFDYLGPDQNEGAFDRNWLVNVLAPRLAEDGFGDVKFVVRDAVSNPWEIATTMKSDQALNNVVTAIGGHYTTNSTTDAKTSRKSLWHSEAWPNFPSSEFRGDKGILDLAKVIMDSYTNGKMVKYLMQPYLEGWYGIVPYNTKSAIQAQSPWSGHYNITPGIWMTAHFTQFAKPGWVYLDDGCRSSGTHNLVTLRKPDSEDYSIIIVNVTDKPQEYTFNLSGGLSTEKVHVWKTNEQEMFVKDTEIQPVDSSFEIVIEPYSLYSLTTTTGQQKGEPKHGIPEKKNLQLPYLDDFESYEIGKAPRYACDQGGAFEIHEGGVDGSKALRQVINSTNKPVDWVYRTTPNPYTILGDLEWANYSVSSDVHLEGSGSSKYVLVGGRVIDSPHDDNPPISYYVRLYGNGNWQLRRYTTTLRSGTIPNFDASQWHNIKLSFLNESIKVYIDENEVTSYDDGVGGIASGSVVLGSSYHTVKFDNLLVEEIDENTPIYVKRLDNIDPTINYTGQWSHIIAVDYAYSNFKRTLSTTSGASPVIRINDSERGDGLNQFNFVAVGANQSWGYYNGASGAYNNDNSWSSAQDNYYEVKFFGTQINVYAAIDSNCGIAAFSIDGGAETLVDMYNPTRIDQHLIYSSPVLPEGVHTLRARVTGTRNSNASSYILNADMVEITRETYEMNALEYTFHGTGFNIIGNIDTGKVVADVYLDGEFLETVNVENTGTGQKKLLYRVAGLAPGEHTITFAASDLVNVDAIEILKARTSEMANKAELEEKIAEASGMDSELYTEETWAVLEEALLQAIEVYEDQEASQHEVTQALAVLQGAIDGLVLKDADSNPFTIITDGTLDRASGIKVTARVVFNQSGSGHAGNEVVVFKLMKGMVPISIIGLESKIATEKEFVTYFNALDPKNPEYTVKVFVFDEFETKEYAPVLLADPVIMN